MQPEERLLVANPMVVCREEFDNWAILFDPDTGKALGINPVGVLIWKNLDGKNNTKNIIKKIKDRFSDVSEEAETHTDQFLQELTKNGFAGYQV
jgi:SynChlorMet cassette protein ScmD